MGHGMKKRWLDRTRDRYRDKGEGSTIGGAQSTLKVATKNAIHVIKLKFIAVRRSLLL